MIFHCSKIFPCEVKICHIGVICRGQLKCDGTGAETSFRLSAKRTSPFKSAGGRQFSRLLAAEVCASAVVMLDTSYSEVVWRVLATHSIRQFPLHFPSRVSPCAITFQLDSNICVCFTQYTFKFYILYFEFTNLLCILQIYSSVTFFLFQWLVLCFFLLYHTQLWRKFVSF